MSVDARVFEFALLLCVTLAVRSLHLTALGSVLAALELFGRGDFTAVTVRLSAREGYCYAILLPAALIAAGHSIDTAHLLALTPTVLLVLLEVASQLQSVRSWPASVPLWSVSVAIAGVCFQVFPADFKVVAWLLTAVLLLSLVGKAIFTCGETLLLAQGFALLFSNWTWPITSVWRSQQLSATTHDLLVIGIAGWILGVVIRKRCHYIVSSAIGLIFVTASYQCLSLRLGQEPVWWLLQLVVRRQPMLVAMWVAVLGPSLVWFSSRPKQALTDRGRLLLLRKGFHALAFVLFVPALLLDAEFFALAAAIALALLLALDVLGDALDGFMGQFRDGQDPGDVLLTHVYLLCAAALPVWLMPSAQGPALFAGVFAVVVGDALASLVGFRIGQHRWPESRKTLEGTAASVVGQWVLLGLFAWADAPGFPLPGAVLTAWQVLFAIVLTAICEGITTQVDNFVLPLVFFAVIQAKA